jgi:hypothetical protein
MHDDSASAEEVAALRAAVLRCHDRFLRMEPPVRSLFVVRRLKRLHLSWLMIPWFLVLTARFLLPGSWRGSLADEEQAVRLYRGLTGKDPHVARAEVWRIGQQLELLDERLRELEERLRELDGQRPETPCGADPAELEAAAAALVGYYLAGRRTDDELLGDVEAAWAEYEKLTEQRLERAKGRGLFRRHTDPAVDEPVHAAADRYRAAWRRWFDRRAERDSVTGPGAG